MGDFWVATVLVGYINFDPLLWFKLYSCFIHFFRIGQLGANTLYQKKLLEYGLLYGREKMVCSSLVY
jgi:hypothetical protein